MTTEYLFKIPHIVDGGIETTELRKRFSTNKEADAFYREMLDKYGTNQQGLYYLSGYSPVSGQAYARATDPGTSHAAAKAVKGEEAGRLERQVVMALELGPGDGLTTHEICAIYGLEYGSVTPRIKPLVRKGLVVDSGIRRVPEGRTKAGIVWKAVEKGQAC